MVFQEAFQYEYGFGKEKADEGAVLPVPDDSAPEKSGNRVPGRTKPGINSELKKKYFTNREALHIPSFPTSIGAVAF